MEIKPLKGNTDIDSIVELGKVMFYESRFARLGFDEEKARKYARNMLESGLLVCFGAFFDGKLGGMVVGICGDTLPFTSAVVANEHLLFVTPEHRNSSAATRLGKAFLAETLKLGSKDTTFSNGTGYQPIRVGRMFESWGLSQVGGLYVKEN